MDCSKFTPNKRKNKHLNAYERGQIALLYQEGLTAYSISKRLGRSPNTIRNELKRGMTQQIKNDKEVLVYYPDVSERKYRKARLNCGRKLKFLTCQSFLEHALDMYFNKSYSIDSICGRTKKETKFKASEMVCTKTLYNYIELGLLPIKNIDLPLKVRRNNKSSRVRKHKKILGRSIDERSEEINNRTKFGHWEIDTVIGQKNKHDEVLLTLTERMTRKEIICKIDSKTTDAVMGAINKIKLELKEDFSKVFKSITSDNGSEFSELSSLENNLQTKIYFAHPYRSGERGTNERHNGLIRRFIPKGKNIRDYSVDFIAYIENWCNSLPRKILGYSTPDEVFHKCLESIL